MLILAEKEEKEGREEEEEGEKSQERNSLQNQEFKEDEIHLSSHNSKKRHCFLWFTSSG